jgi:Domain of unknown function (DUF4145)
MKCPHCQLGIFENFARSQPFHTNDGQTWLAWSQICPECKKPIINLEANRTSPPNQLANSTPRFLAYPRNASARPLPAEVPDPYRIDFDEAVAVFPLSPKASAALSRRNLQAVLRDKANTASKDLFDQIEEVIASGKLPSHMADGLHAVRNIGNFAAHEIKSKTTGAIVDVEAGEAEWNLDVLESLFDFYFVEPQKAAKRKAELNKKLREAGKTEIP